MNIDMPQADGLDATREIKASHAETKVILLSSVDDTAHNRAAGPHLPENCADGVDGTARSAQDAATL